MKRRISLLPLVLALSLLALLQPAAAQPGQTSLNFLIESGFDGYVKNNAWTPIRVLATNTGPDVAGEIRFQPTFPGEIYAYPLSLPSQSQKEIVVYIPLRSGDLSFQYVNDGDILFQGVHAPRLISPGNFLVGVVSSDPGLLNFLAGLQTSRGDPLSVAHLDLADLPDRTEALAALDALVFNDFDTTSLTPDQKTGLSEWVLAGGRLIVAGGPNGALTAAGLSNLLPVADLTSTNLSSLSALSNYTGDEIPPQGPYLAAIPAALTGQVQINQDGQALLVERVLGQGRVTYFALDLGLAPMNGWAGNETFWQQVLSPVQGQLPFYTTYDSIRSINNVLANIDLATLPHPGTLILYLCSYILLLVPLNYLVLRRLKRREWAWVSIPALIILFSLVGYIAGFRARGGRALLRQVSIVQQTNDTLTTNDERGASVDTFIGLYSPARRRYTLRFAEGVLVQPTDDGSGYQGVRGGASAPTTIYYGQQTELQNLWTDVGSMATVVSHSHQEPYPITLELTVVRQGANWLVSGLIDNRSGQALEDAALVIDDHGVRLGTLPRGETRIDQPLQLLNVHQPYSDQTIFGDSYYQLDDRQVILSDQIIRSVLWPDAAVQLLSPNPTSGDDVLSGGATLVGWQNGDGAAAPINVVGQRVDRDTFNLLIVRSRAEGL